MPYVLNSEQIDVCGETLTVFQASNAMDMDRTFRITEASSGAAPKEGDTREEYMFYVSTLLYPSLVACTQGNIPTLEEFMYQMPTEASNLWVETARRLNPLWFKFVTEAEAELEKKEP